MTNNEELAVAPAQPSPASAPMPVAPPQKNPAFTLGVVGFALSLIAFLNIAGLIISIVALVRSRRRGFSNGFALAGIIIAGIGVGIGLIIVATAVPTLIDASQTCARLGDGVHELDGATYTCTPTSFSVYRHF